MSKLAWVAALSTCLACQEDPALIEPVNSQRGCITDDQCEVGDLCVFRLCSPACEGGSCASGRLCFDVGRDSACVRAADNACVDDSDCPAAADCVRGRCLSKQCQSDGGEACGDSCELGLCHPGLADAGVSTSSDAGTPASCRPGASSCRDKVLLRCDSSGRMLEERACPYLCNDGACSGSCRPGEMRCQDRTREECDASGTWQDVEMCRNMCTPDACTSSCTDGARQCNGTSLMVCRRGQMVEAQRCDYLCQSGACTGSCVPGTHQCRSNAVYTCDAAGAWGMRVDCANACVNGACGGECVPGTQRCDDGRSYQTCNGRGQWSPSIECRGQACADGECTGDCAPGATRCEGAASMATCGASGEWSVAVACVDQVCTGDRCTGMCVPGSARCRPDTTQQPQTCTAQSSWIDATRCAANQACVNGACGGVCAPNTKRCDPLSERNVQTCLSNGQWGVGSACPGNLLCNGQAECAAAPSCPPDASPDWYAPGAGANRALNDPRWGGALDRFAGGSGMDPNAGGYAIVYDRPSNQLVVSVRALAEDVAAAQDYVFFGIRSNAAGEASAYAARIPLDVAPAGSDPRPIAEITSYQAAGNSWVEQAGEASWLQHPAAWVMSPEASWAVSFRVDLATIGVDPASPVQVALGLHAENMLAEYNPVTPAQLMIGMPAAGMSRTWPALDLTGIMCAGRARLP
jgi:hypothetical protein